MLACCVAFTNKGFAQPYNLSNLRSKIIAVQVSQRLDSFSIVPRTFFIKEVDTTYYHIDLINAVLSWKKQPPMDSVHIMYRVFPYRLNATARRYTYDSIVNNFKAAPFVFNRNGNPGNVAGLFDFGTMNYNGSFARALSFGNNQDVVVNSQFNLQLNGLLGDSIQVAAAITDNNIPIQPDGTTQQLNEFDRVWLQFKKNGWEANLGDIDIRQNQSYFLNFYKRAQGISYSTTSKPGPTLINKTIISGAVAKGKFTRNIFQGLEGNQGPYRLQGANNEFFFIVLAATERVFIDGQLLQRGEDQDYVINYNTAEISFTPRRMVTKDSRIQVEFEYADRNYLNALLFASNETVINKRLAVTVSAYNNSDAKNSPINQSLDNRQKQFLNAIGDSVNKAFYPSAVLDSFDVGKILYARIDTAYNGTTDSIYVFSTDKDRAKYALGFIEVGFGRGNYINDFNAANGKVYKWIRPLNNMPQGNFEPATFLVTPKKLQVLSISASYKIGDESLLTTEVASSNYDANTFSINDKADNKGLAAKVNYTNNINVGGKSALALQTNAGYEYVHKNFRPLERLRAVEFYRNWGLDYLPVAATEQLPSLTLKLADKRQNYVQYRFTSYLRSDNFKGARHEIDHKQNIQGWLVNNVFSLTNSNAATSEGFFLRPSIDFSKTFEKLNGFTFGSNFFIEYNEVRNKLTDTISPLSFAFTNFSAFIKTNQLKDNRFSLSYFTRKNQLPVGKQLLATDQSQNFTLSAEFLGNSHHQLRTNITYRLLNIKNTQFTNLTPENSLLGRAEYAINEWKGFVTGNVLYEMGSGQEQRRDFSYLEVPAGRGEFAWNDYNGDDIPQINEFETAVFQDQAKYIRVFTPTNQFVKANYTQLNYSLTLSPKNLLAQYRNKKWANVLGRFNLQSTLQVAKKVLNTGSVVFNPFKGGIADTSLITLNNAVANTVSFNRFSSKWGIDVSNSRNYNKALLTYGFESRQVNDWSIKGRCNITRQFGIELVQKLGNNALATPSFANRNYNIQSVVSEPGFTYTRGTTLRFVTGYQYNHKQNSPLNGGETSTNNSFTVESKYNAANSISLNGKFTYSKIDYTGAVNSTVSYIMLDALLPGKNYLWNIDLVKRLGNNLELSFQYEGRKPGSTRTIHTGRASLRALL